MPERGEYASLHVVLSIRWLPSCGDTSQEHALVVLTEGGPMSKQQEASSLPQTADSVAGLGHLTFEVPPSSTSRKPEPLTYRDTVAPRTMSVGRSGLAATDTTGKSLKEVSTS